MNIYKWREMTDDEIIKALECCVEDVANCGNCPYERYCDMHQNNMLEDALDLINRQRAEIDDLTRDTIPKLRASLDRANKYGIEADKEIEHKDRILDSYALQYGSVADKDVLLKRAKAEAVREFEDALVQELLPSGMVLIERYSINAKAVRLAIYNLAKEMVGEQG